MARTIAAIKKTMTDEFMASEEAQIKYGFSASDKWEDTFSLVSIENILFYVFAVALYSVELLLDNHITSVNNTLLTSLPHTSAWYCNTVLNFRYGVAVDTETGEYIDQGLSASKIEESQIVKFASVTENTNDSYITLKVAGETNGERSKLSSTQLSALRAYLDIVRDAGVRITLLSQEADEFNVELSVVYSEIYDATDIESEIENTITQYIQNLPFNGIYSNMALVDVIQQIDGVVDVTVVSASYQGEEDTAPTAITSRAVADSGYFKKGTYTINLSADE